MTVLDEQAQRASDSALPAGVCAHCGLPAPASRSGDAAFCCNACKSAYEIIHGCGLDRYYDLAKLSQRTAAPAAGRGAQYTEFDHPQFMQRHAQSLQGGLMRIELGVRGVHCAACIWLIERLPRLVDGVISIHASAPTARVTITWDPRQVKLSHIAATLDQLGYAAHVADAQHGEVRAYRQMMLRVGVAGAIAGNVMLVSVALYGGAFSGIESRFSLLFRWVGFALALLSVAWPGRVFLRSAWTALRVGVPHIDIPVALGLVVALVAGAISTVRNSGDVYFDTVCVLVFFLLAGRWVQETQQRRASSTLSLMATITPSGAHRCEDGLIRDVPSESLVPGDEVEVRAGESIPVDGTVCGGTSHLDLSVLTGESRPVHVGVGDAVLAGATNLGSTLRVNVRTTGAETRLGRLMQLVASAAERKAPIVRAADRIAGRFVIIVSGLALATLVGWLIIDASRAASAATAVLIVTCPCALALATPLAVMVGIRRAAAQSILIKGGDVIEALAGGGTVVLDKTGTITQGRGEVTRWMGDGSIKPWVGALSAHSNHPVAVALGRHCGTSKVEAKCVVQVVGAGMVGEVGGHELWIGNAALAAQRGEPLPEWAQQAIATLVSERATPVLVSVDGSVRAVAGVGDALRADSAKAIAWLQHAGWNVMLCSGDCEEIVRSVADEVGIRASDALGACAPERKLEVIRDRANKGVVVMVGDGVNDAAALAEATVGVAVHGGAEASMHAADVYLAQPGLEPLVSLVDGARHTMRIIRINLGVSLAYNMVCATLAVIGLITPLVAAVLMPMSSITVIGISQSLRSFGRTSP